MSNKEASAAWYIIYKIEEAIEMPWGSRDLEIRGIMDDGFPWWYHNDTED